MFSTKPQIQCGKSMSDIFTTNTGVPQGDGINVNEFTLYLVRALKKEHQGHSYARTHIVSQVISYNHCYAIAIIVI